MAETLYTLEILRLAMSLGSGESLEHPDGAAKVRSEICGSEVAVQVKLDAAGRIEQIGISAKACAVGQASAAIVKRNAIGKTGAKIAEIEAGLSSFLQGNSGMPAEWPELEELAPAREYPARHSAILLSFEALNASLADAQENKAA